MALGSGAVIWRKAHQSHVQILLLHDVVADEWTLPTQRALPHERPPHGEATGEATGDDMVHLVQQLTGLWCTPGPRLAPVRCARRGGPAERVTYWPMRALGGTFQPNATFDEAWWLLEHEVAAVASRAHDVVAAQAVARQRNGLYRNWPVSERGGSRTGWYGNEVVNSL